MATVAFRGLTDGPDAVRASPPLAGTLASWGAKTPQDLAFLDDSDIASLELSPAQKRQLKEVARAAEQP